MSNMEMSRREFLFWTLSLILVTFFWGTTFVLVKSALSDISSTQFLMIRFTASFLISIVTIRFFFKDTLKDLLITRHGFFLGMLLFVSYLFQTIGLETALPSNAAFITGLSVPLTPVLLIAFFRSSVSKSAIFWAFLACIGLAIMTLDFDTLSAKLGDILILVTAVAVSFHIIYTGFYTERFTARQRSIGPLVIGQFFSMMIYAWLFSIVVDEGRVFEFNFSLAVAVALIITVIFATIFAFGTQTLAQRKGIPSPYIALIYILEPVFALLTSLVTGGELLTAQKLFGVVVMMAAVIFSVLLQNPSHSPIPE